MAYSYCIREGNQVKVSLCKSGVSQKGFAWTNFKFEKKSKDKETGRYVQQGMYEVWVNNGVEIQNGDIVKLDRIISVEQKYYVKNNVKHYLVVLWCNISLVSSIEDVREEKQNFDLDDVEQFDVGDQDLDGLFDI